MFKTPTLWVDTFSELVFLKLLNNDDIECKKSSIINYRRHVQEHVQKIKINFIIENK